MKISRKRKAVRRRFALQPTCPNCGREGRHELARTLEDVVAGRRFFACSQIQIVEETLEGVIAGKAIELILTGETRI